MILGAPFRSDYALVKWTDTSGTAMRSVKYMGFTASDGAEVEFGTNCILLNTQLGLGGGSPFGQVASQQQTSINLNQIQPQYTYGSLVSNRQPAQPSLPMVNDQVQILQPNSAPGIRQEVPLGAKPWLNPSSATELEIVTQPEQTIIEPVLRNQYLTKLKRLLPTFFDEFGDGDIE